MPNRKYLFYQLVDLFDQAFFTNNLISTLCNSTWHDKISKQSLYSYASHLYNYTNQIVLVAATIDATSGPVKEAALIVMMAQLVLVEWEATDHCRIRCF